MLSAASTLLLSTPMDRATFARRLRLIAGTPLALWLPAGADGLTNVSWPDTRTWTHSASQAGRVTYRGNGVLVSLNGTDQNITTPDAANLSFGDGTSDSAFSVVVGGVITGGTTRTLMAKWADTGVDDEWRFFASSNILKVHLRDASAVVQANRDASAASYSDNVFSVNGFSYDGGGGATAANGIALYTNGRLVTSAATNNASYVAMEGLTQPLSIGADSAAAQPVAGRMGFGVLYAANLTAAQHAAISDLAGEYYGVAA